MYMGIGGVDDPNEVNAGNRYPALFGHHVKFCSYHLMVTAQRSRCEKILSRRSSNPGL